MNLSRRIINMLIALCALVTVALGAYLIYNYFYIPWETEKANERYAAMYSPAAATAAPDTSAAPTPLPSPVPTAEASPAPEATQTPHADVPDDVMLGTAGPDTIVYVSITPPPPDESFAELLRANPETAGFLRISDELALPVVQRAGDNDFYLTHDFEGAENSAGCLFLDGANWLYPRDECLYVYGHNMKNGTMFGSLDAMATPEGLIEYFPVYFDTLYDSGVYVPFACFTLSGDVTSGSYFHLRRFDLSELGYAEFVKELKKRSILDIPIDAVYGDDMLILVTCNYSINDGRFVVALRRLRDGETVDGIRQRLDYTKTK